MRWKPIATYWEARGAEVKVRPMLEWTATGTVRTDTIVHDSEFRIACPWGNNTMAIHQDGSVVCCAVDYEGKFKAGNVGEITVKEAWRRLGERVRTPASRASLEGYSRSVQGLRRLAGRRRGVRRGIGRGHAAVLVLRQRTSAPPVG